MKKTLKIVFLILILCISLNGCANKVENQLIGQWKYDTGMCVWNIIFEENGKARFSSGMHWTVASYEIDEECQKVSLNWTDQNNSKEHEWLFSYEKLKNGIDLIHPLGWHFEKNKEFDEKSEKKEYESYEMMFDEVLSEVTELVKNGDAEDFAFKRLQYEYPDITFFDFEITSQARESYYTYSVYGKVRSKDKFGDKYVDKIEVMYRAEKSSDGYTIMRYLYKYDENNKPIL